jgi:chaperone modulatory protein CbpM
MLTERDLVGRIDGFSVEELRYCVRRGWVAPSAAAGGSHYLEVDVARLRFVRELRFDLEVDEEAIPILLSLLDQLHTLRHELRALAGAVGEQPADVRERIAGAMKRFKPAG